MDIFVIHTNFNPDGTITFTTKLSEQAVQYINTNLPLILAHLGGKTQIDFWDKVLDEMDELSKRAAEQVVLLTVQKELTNGIDTSDTKNS